MILDFFKYYTPEYKGEDNLLFHSQGLYFQNPKNFNYPWDCTPPHITIPRTINTIEQVWNHISRNDPTAESKWQEICRRPRAEIKASFEKIFEQSFLHSRSRIGICSLSFIPDSELLWAHYSNSHSGYLLHFQINMKDYFTNPTLKHIATPIPVIYLRERKCWNFADYYNERLKFVYDYVRFKSHAWSYE